MADLISSRVNPWVHARNTAGLVISAPREQERRPNVIACCRHMYMAGRSSDTLLRYDAAGWNFHGATNLDWLLSGVGHSSTRANAMSWLRENEITDVEALRELPGAAEQFITGLQLRPGALAEKIIRARLGAGRPADPASALTMQLIRQAAAGGLV